MATLFHIGFRKTGTSTLQHHFFPHLDRWGYLGLGSPRHLEFRPLIGSLLGDGDARYRGGELRELIDRERAGRDGVIVSREHISTFHRRDFVAPRVRALAPDAKVLVCVRHHRTILPSAYGQHVKSGGTFRFGEWAERAFAARSFHYEIVVARYQELFGRDAVLVLPFELLVGERDAFLDRVYGFMTEGAPPPRPWPVMPPENVAVSAAILPYLRVVNRATKPFPRLHSRRVRLRAARSVDRALFSRSTRGLSNHDSATVERLLPRYADSNARLQELAAVDLAAYGYPLP